MAPHVQASRVLHFGTFEVDLRAGELRKSGARIKLQEQPFQVLTMLLEKPGKLITREELHQKLWPADTFVSFDDGLNTAIKKLRDTLGDSADSPRFIETLPKRGYRFIYPVNGARAPAEVQVLPMAWWRRPWAAGMLAFTALLAIAVAANVGGLRDRITGRTGFGPIASVAVLPCKNPTGDPEQEFLADGLTDILTTHLAQVKSLTVPSITSSMYFKGEVSRDLFLDGHPWEAVFAASKALVNYIKERSGRHDLDGTSLVRTVFSKNAGLSLQRRQGPGRR